MYNGGKGGGDGNSRSKRHDGHSMKAVLLLGLTALTLCGCHIGVKAVQMPDGTSGYAAQCAGGLAQCYNRAAEMCQDDGYARYEVVSKDKAGAAAFASGSMGMAMGINEIMFRCTNGPGPEAKKIPEPAPTTPKAADSAQPSDPLDTILLANGGRLRGTVFEEDPKLGVGIRLPDGSTRRFKQFEVKKVLYRGQ
jgi:hypothetical protein